MQSCMQDASKPCKQPRISPRRHAVRRRARFAVQNATKHTGVAAIGDAILKGGVSGATFLLNGITGRDSKEELPAETIRSKAQSIEELKDRIEIDYKEHQYFVTGEVDRALYSEDCLFADPTIQFRGLDKYVRNLKSLKGFFIQPRIELFAVQVTEDIASNAPAIKADWHLTVTLKLPWKPYIDVLGSTKYTLHASKLQIVKHVESWNVTPWQAVLQIFRLPQQKPGAS